MVTIPSGLFGAPRIMNSIFIQRNIPYSLRKMIEHETNAPKLQNMELKQLDIEPQSFGSYYQMK